jgi:hypothetical protein
VECWFGILNRHALRNLSCREAQQLREAIDHFVKAYQQTATPFEWTKASALKMCYSYLCK